MATARQLRSLFKALAAGDISTANAVAEEICRAEEQRGHKDAARTLRAALHNSESSPTIGGIRTEQAFIASALVKLKAPASLDEMTLSPVLRNQLSEINEEWQKRSLLRRHGLEPRHKLLFYGPPGCGKSLAAQALGRAAGLPVYMVRFDAIIGAYLGQTAIHLRQLFAFIETTACVLLLDELDALGKKRGNPLDVGELDRIVISLMQELEHSRPRGLVVGTSNLPRHLDDALWRRFDLTLHFKSPTQALLSDFVARRVRERNVVLPQRIRAVARAQKSYADADAVISAEIRRQVMARSAKTDK